MENRDRDNKMSKNVGSTSTGDVNRSTSSNLDKSKNESQADFGKNIGRSENLGSEPSRRSGSVDSSSGMQGSQGRSQLDSSKSDLGKQEIGSRRGGSNSSNEH